MAFEIGNTHEVQVRTDIEGYAFGYCMFECMKAEIVSTRTHKEGS